MIYTSELKVFLNETSSQKSSSPYVSIDGTVKQQCFITDLLSSQLLNKEIGKFVTPIILHLPLDSNKLSILKGLTASYIKINKLGDGDVKLDLHYEYLDERGINRAIFTTCNPKLIISAINSINTKSNSIKSNNFYISEDVSDKVNNYLIEAYDKQDKDISVSCLTYPNIILSCLVAYSYNVPYLQFQEALNNTPSDLNQLEKISSSLFTSAISAKGQEIFNMYTGI